MVEGSLKPKFLLALSVALVTNLFNAAQQDACAKGKSKSGAAPAAGTPLRSTPAPQDNAPQVVQQWEERLFFKHYADEDLGARLARIEKNIFGQAIEGSNDDRLARLDELLRSKLAEEEKQKAAAPGGTAGGAAPNATPTAPKASTTEDDIERARASIQAAREDEIATLLAEGVELFRKKRGMQAQEKFEQVLRLDPTNGQAHFNLGIIEEAMGNFVEALASYKQAAAREPDNPEYKEAVQAIEKKANAQANSLGRRADLRALAEQANAAWKRGEYYSALDLYQQLDQKEPNRALVKYNIGSIYLMLKDPDSAVGFYQQAAKLEPGEPKYQKAYKELAAELAKGQKEQQKAEKEATKEWKEQHSPQQAQTANAREAKGGAQPKVGTKFVQSNSVQPPQQYQQQPRQVQTYSQGYSQGYVPPGGQQMMGMQGMNQMQNMQGMNQMQNMQGINRMQNMQGINRMQNMQGMNPMQNMQGMNPMQNMQGMNPMQNMQGMNPMQNMQGMNQMQNMQGMNPMQNMQGANNMQNMTAMNGGMNNGFQQGYTQQQMNPGYPQQQMNTGMMQQPMQQQQQPMQQQPMQQRPQQMQPIQQMQQMPNSGMGSGNMQTGADMMAQFGIVGRSNGEGVTVVKVGNQSRAQTAGLVAGDDIKAVDGIQVSGTQEILDILSRINPAKRIPFLIMRNGNLAVLQL